MFQDSFNRLNASNESQKPIGCKRGCSVLLIPFVVIYFSHAIFLIIANALNKIKWQIHGSVNYQYTISKYGLLPKDFQLGRNVVVKDGEIALVSNVSFSETVYSSDLETIEEMLNGVYFCSFLFPLYICSFEYDPLLGYPSKITVNCPITDACYTKVVVRNLEILSP